MSLKTELKNAAQGNREILEVKIGFVIFVFGFDYDKSILINFKAQRASGRLE